MDFFVEIAYNKMDSRKEPCSYRDVTFGKGIKIL